MEIRALLPPTWKNLYYPPEKSEYVYFAGRDEFPFPASGNIQTRYAQTNPRLLPFVKAAYAADASMLGYQGYGQAPMPEEDFRNNLKNFTYQPLRTGLATGTEGYFARQDDFAIMAFRGTEKGDPKDSFTDLSLLLVPEPDYSTAAEEPQKALRHLSFIESLFHPSPCKVHHGFQRALNDVWNEVHQYLWDYRKAHPHSEIVFAGHSLGAALATLAVSCFGGGNASLYTFGCPRTGNEVFCQRVVNQADQGVFRFVNGNDPVTHVPPEDLGYRHTSPPLRHIDYEGNIQELATAPVGVWTDLARVIQGLPRAGLFTDLDSRTAVYLADHSPAQYCIRVWNYVAGRVA